MGEEMEVTPDIDSGGALMLAGRLLVNGWLSILHPDSLGRTLLDAHAAADALVLIQDNAKGASLNGRITEITPFAVCCHWITLLSSIER